MTNCSDAERRASVVIPVYNGRVDLLECLEALETELADAEDVEVIVVDDGSDDGVAEAVRHGHPHVRLLVNDGNQGPAYARNRASAEARGALLVYVDSDGIVTPGWLGQLLDADDGHTVLLGCVVDYDGGRVQGVPRRATFLGKSLRCRPERANTGPSCNLAAPRRCFDALGGFDEEIPYYFEDSDFCLRARRAGFRFRYLPNAVFRHKGSEKKQGDAIRLQEHNSTYAMLKAYRERPLLRAGFTVLNAVWLVGRLTVWLATGRRADAGRLWRGWRSAYQRFGALG